MTARHAVRRRLMGTRTVSIRATSGARPFGSGAARVLAGFGLITLAAVPILMLPAASEAGRSASLLDALFTAVSAVCVTGLTVADTQTQWSFLGEAVILALVQVGGLGYMAGMGVVLWALGRSLGLRDRNLIRLYYGAPSMREAATFLRVIVIYTLVAEALGALALFGGFTAAGVPPERGAWWAVFHAVSAFNVSGFNVTGADMTPFRDAPAVLAPMILLVLAGSLGAVPVVMGALRLNPRRMPLDAKVVLSAAVCVLVAAAAFIAASEWTNTGTLASVGAGDRPLLAFFQAAMWTSGFSAVDSGLLHDHTKLFESALMLVGGAAGSPAGGMKLGVLAVVAVAAVAALRGRDDVVLFGRQLPRHVVRQAITIAAAFAACHFLATMLLLAASDGIPFIDVLFEASSALGTVGWSAGATPLLGDAATVIAMLTILVGRFLPIVLVLRMTRRRKPRVGAQLVDGVRFG